MHRGMVGGFLLLVTGALPCVAAAQECAWTVRQLTSSEFSTGNQTISGDGQRLALSRFDGSPIPFIHLVDASTGRMRNVAAGYYPVLAGDGNRIVFVDSQNDLAAVNVASGETRKWFVGPIAAESFAVSADGSRIAFISDRQDLTRDRRNPAGSRQVFLLDAASGAIV